MDNKKIPTHLGIIVIVIIAITAGMFAWQYEKNMPIDSVQSVVSAPVKKSPKQLVPQPVTKTAQAVDGIVYTNTQYGFQLTLPKGWENYKAVVNQAVGTNRLGIISIDMPTSDKTFSGYPDSRGKSLDGYASMFLVLVYDAKGYDAEVARCKREQDPDCFFADPKNTIRIGGSKYIYAINDMPQALPVDLQNIGPAGAMDAIKKSFKNISQNYIEVKELGFKIPVDSSSAGELTYKIVKPEGIDYSSAEFSSKTGGCDAGTISKISGTPAKNSTGEAEFYKGRLADIKQFDGFFLFYQHPQAVSCDAKYADTEKKMTQVVSDSLKNTSLIGQ